MKIFKSEYRVVTDNYLGYEVQKRRWWWPFWIQCGFSNTHSSLEAAKKYIEIHAQKEVWRGDA